MPVGVVNWVSAFFGWPAIVVSLGALAAGTAMGRTWISAAGALASGPFCWYATHAPWGWVFGPAIFAANVASAVQVRRGRRGLAAACLMPYAAVLLAIVLALVVPHGRR